MSDPVKFPSGKRDENNNRFCGQCGCFRFASPQTDPDEFGPCPHGADTVIECLHIKQVYLNSRLHHSQGPLAGISKIEPVDGVNPEIAALMARLGIGHAVREAWWKTYHAGLYAKIELRDLAWTSDSWLHQLKDWLADGPVEERFVALVNELHIDLVPDTSKGMTIGEIFAWQEDLARRVSDEITEDHCWETGE